jgi:hypothetical protein
LPLHSESRPQRNTEQSHQQCPSQVAAPPLSTCLLVCIQSRKAVSTRFI